MTIYLYSRYCSSYGKLDMQLRKLADERIELFR